MTRSNLELQFDQELKKLGSGGAAVLSVDSQRRTLTCELVQRNPLAVSFDLLRLATTELSSAGPADLERIGKALAERLTYLMEPIAPIEIDAAACTVQLRSNPPQRDDDGRSYYELIIRRGGEITLMRFHKEDGSVRQQVPATVTREVLLRLIGDFCAVLG
jgi:hypothetical protein